MAEADTFVAGKVGTGLGGGDQIVGRHGIIGMGQRDIYEFGAQPPIGFDGGVHGLLDIGVEPGNEILPGQADPEPLDTVRECRNVIRHGQIDAGGILGIVTGQRPQHDGTVGHIAGQRSDLVQG